MSCPTPPLCRRTAGRDPHGDPDAQPHRADAAIVLLDCPLEEARQGHRLTEGGASPAGAAEVGSFAGRGGKRQTLWRLGADGSEGGSSGAGGSPDSSERASLEDVVLGYLAAGRGTAGLRLD